jgi:hypothetical protein
MRTRSLRPRALACAGIFLALETMGCSADPSAPIETVAVSRVERAGASASGDLERAAVDYLRGLEGELAPGAGGEYAALVEEEGAGGLRRARLQQLHEGLPVVGSEIQVHADQGSFVGLSGLVTTNLDGFDVAPSLDGDQAASIAQADLARIAPDSDSSLAGAELVILPRQGGGANLAWQVELAGGWGYFIDAHDGRLLGSRPEAQGCSLWEKLKCKVGAADCSDCSAECGDGSCNGEETDSSCRQDCGCSAVGDLCGDYVPAPFGCWCDADCADAGDCCADAPMCELPPAPDGGQGAPCEHGEKDAGFFDGARLNYYRAKYYAIAQGGGLAGAEDAKRYLLHFLGNSGDELEVDVDRMLKEIPSFKEAVEEARTGFAADAADDARAAEATGTVTTATPVEWDSSGTDSGESFNWYYALGTWDWNHTGTVAVTPAAGESFSFDVDGRVHVSKHYDWDPDKKVGPGGIFDQSELAELHCYGWAQEFWIKGMSSESSQQGTVQ